MRIFGSERRAGARSSTLAVIVSRLIAAIPLVFVVTTVTFFLGQLSPVDPAELVLGDGATEQQVEAARARMGLDRPVMEQYTDWLGGAMLGDLGESVYTSADVTDTLIQAMPVTLSLTFGGLFVSLLVGVPAGILSAIKAGRSTDKATSLVVTVAQAVPNFWLAILLVFLFALGLGWFPAVGYVGITEDPFQWLRSITLPSLALGLSAAAAIARQTRSSLIGVLQLEYIRTALAKGLSVRRVVGVHALKNAAIPVVTVLSFQLAALLGGSLVVERIFAMRGVGAVAIDAVIRRDPDVVQGVVLLTVIVIVLVNIALDLSYSWFNPKVRAT